MDDKSMFDPQLKKILDQMPQPISSSQHKSELLAQMTNLLPSRKTRWQRLLEWYPLVVLISQRRVIQKEIWAASAIVLGLGVVLSLVEQSPNGTIFAAIAPIVATAGVSMLYDPTVRLMLEIEETTRTSAQQLVLARLVLVFGFDLGLTLLGSIILALTSTQISLFPLISSWLAPMFFLSALAFFLGILLTDSFAAAAFSLILWVFNLLFRTIDAGNPLFELLSMPGLSVPSNRPVLMSVAALLLLVAIWLINIQERHHRGYD